MDKKTTKNLNFLLAQYVNKKLDDSLINCYSHSEPPTSFKNMTHLTTYEGGYYITDTSGLSIWVLLVKWNNNHDYHLVIYPENKSSPVAEIKTVSGDEYRKYLHWKYSPSKHDGRNNERKEYFEKSFSSLDVEISLPRDVEEVSEFFGELLSLANNRLKADELEPDKIILQDRFPEGKAVEKLHKSRERNPRLVELVKANALEKHGKLECQCCGFNFSKVYGELGSGYIEAHHTKPVSQIHKDGGNTKIEDMALVCSNCHRMLHRRRPWLEINNLKMLINKKARK